MPKYISESYGNGKDPIRGGGFIPNFYMNNNNPFSSPIPTTSPFGFSQPKITPFQLPIPKTAPFGFLQPKIIPFVVPLPKIMVPYNNPLPSIIPASMPGWVPPVATAPVVAPIQTMTTAAVNYININATIVDDAGGPLPLANVSVSGVPVARTDNKGFVSLYKVASNALIKVTYLGLVDYVQEASTFPKKVQMKATAAALDTVVVTSNPKASMQDTISKGLFWFSAIGGAFLIYKKLTEKNTIKAKI